MNECEEHLLGFDARQSPRSPSETWDADRRRTYLLKPDASRILSTDGMVWPSCFRQPLPDGLPDEVLVQIDTSAPLTPDWIGMNAPFWESLSELERHLARHTCPNEGWIVAATCLVTEELKKGLQYGPHFVPTEPPARDSTWRFLGYDVSDRSFLSGLTNCGYREDDFAEVPRERWARALNENHLFRDIEDAMAFREFSDRRIPEHAPFLVYGLHVV